MDDLYPWELSKIEEINCHVCNVMSQQYKDATSMSYSNVVINHPNHMLFTVHKEALKISLKTSCESAIV